MRFLTPLLTLFCLISFSGCDTGQESSESNTKQNRVDVRAKANPTIFLQEPIRPAIVETSAEAILTWRTHSQAKPTLILLAKNPLLQPVPSAMENEANDLVQDGTQKDLANKTLPSGANPVILPHMALSAALNSRLFSKVLWILPASADEQVSLGRFREKMLSLGDLSADEAETFKVQDGALTGTVRDTAITVAHYHDLPSIEGPAIVHFELDFFPPLYINEIKTPLYPLVYKLLRDLREQKYNVLATTISLGNLSNDLPLQVRFLGDLISRNIQNPERIDAPPSGNESRRSQALYLENFFQKDKIRDLYLAMEAEAPQDASVKYDLYQSARRFKEGNKALDYLQQAVTLDHIYGMEYLELAEVALEQDLYEQAISMLKLAMESFPESTFIELKLADTYLQSGASDQAKEVLSRLEKQPWSPIYHAGVPELLKQMSAIAGDGKE